MSRYRQTGRECLLDLLLSYSIGPPDRQWMWVGWVAVGLIGTEISEIGIVVVCRCHAPLFEHFDLGFDSFQTSRIVFAIKLA